MKKEDKEFDLTTNCGKLPEELKILKDIEPIEERFVFRNALKTESIKHYKAVKNGNLVIDVPTYIRWANNLEEDLMNNEEVNNREHGEIGNN